MLQVVLVGGRVHVSAENVRWKVEERGQKGSKDGSVDEGHIPAYLVRWVPHPDRVNSARDKPKQAL